MCLLAGFLNRSRSKEPEACIFKVAGARAGALGEIQIELQLKLY